MKILSPCAALVVQTFWPVTTNSSPSSTPVVRRAARSEPAPGSEKPWHQMTSLRSSSGMISRFCSSVPTAMTVGTRKVRPIWLTEWGTRARALSSSWIACMPGVPPRPPYSRGREMPAKPAL